MGDLVVVVAAGAAVVLDAAIEFFRLRNIISNVDLISHRRHQA